MRNVYLPVFFFISLTMISSADECADNLTALMGDEVPWELFNVNGYVWEEKGIEVVEIREEFRPIIILGDGLYYDEDGRWFAREIPSEAAKGLALGEVRLRVNGEDETTSFYLIECDDGWTGWTDYYYDPRLDFRAEVTASALNVRNSPGIGSDIVRSVKKDDILLLHSRSSEKEAIDGITDYWYAINVDETEWVFGGYLRDTYIYDIFDYLEHHDYRSNSVLIMVVNELMEVPSKMYLPWDTFLKDTGGREPNSSYQSQALYWGCWRLMNSGSLEGGNDISGIVLEWADKLEKEYGNETVFEEMCGYGYEARAEAQLIRVAVYSQISDKINFEIAVLKCYEDYYSTGRYQHECDTTYGIDLATFWIDELAENWGTEYAVYIINHFLQITPTGEYAALLYRAKGDIYSLSEDHRLEALTAYNKVIDDYPFAGRYFFLCKSVYAHDCMENALRVLPDEKGREEFLRNLAGVSRPYPIRLYAACLLYCGYSRYNEDHVLVEYLGPNTGYKTLFLTLLANEHEEYCFEWLIDYPEE